ncbi:MAG: HDIG domain-containing protein [Treponema sp.]
MKDETFLKYIKSFLINYISDFFKQKKEMVCAEKAFFLTLLLSFFTVTAAILFIILGRSGLAYLNIDDFAVGKVAERDVAVDRDISYTDQTATDIRRAARLQTVAPIFRQDAEIASKILKKYDEFLSFILALRTNEETISFAAQVQEQYPGFFEPRFLHSLQKVKNLDVFLTNAQVVVKQAMAVGIAEFPDKGLEGFNQAEITLAMRRANNREYMNVQTGSIIRVENLISYIKTAVRSFDETLDPESMTLLIRPFLQPNLIYDAKETEARVQEVLKQVPPVIVTIQKNQKIIKRGFIITAENYRQLQAYAEAGNYLDVGKFIGIVCFLICLYAAGLFTFSKQALNSPLKESQKIFLLLISMSVYLSILFIEKSSFFVLPLDILPFIPAALAAMLIHTLISEKVAVLSVFFTMLLVLTASGFKLEPALFALLSGLSAVSLMNLTGRRMDLIKTACQLACIHPLITAVLLTVFPNSYSDFTFVFLGSVINGFISGIFVLGFLPILEAVMNTPTCFRLMELSDLNSPTMKQMLLTVPGTYNHTLMVASLAEIACRAIGANALLARVGAYHHDLGKMANSEYFVENQTSYNKHLDLNPRLSATIIRSHVKIGIEKAENMRLPQEVIDIIGEHHGNSLVQYFYAKAKELDPNVSPTDFSYPGQPPRTKESAVVMLADITEAACRTLERPSVPRLEKFIDKLIKSKMDAGQLDHCELTLRELKVIHESFVTTLASYYHSRIKYPNQKDPDEKTDEKSEQLKPLAEKEGGEDKAAAVKEIAPDVKQYIQVDLGLSPSESSAAKEEKKDE